MGRSTGRSGPAGSAGRNRREPAPRGHQPARRRSGDHQPRKSRSQRDEPRVGWARRVGIAGALLLVGVSVVFAGQGLLSGGEPGGGTPTPEAPVATPIRPDVLAAAPELTPPGAELTSADRIQLQGRLSGDLPRDGSYRLRVYVNGERAIDRRLPRRQRFTVGVPLVEGSNSITAAVAGPLGESLHSTPVVLERDATAPALTVDEPTSGVVYADTVMVRGRSDAGAELQLTNAANGASVDVALEESDFEISVPLVVGANQLRLEVRDAAGNAARATIDLERRDGSASVALVVSPQTVALDALPATLSLHARVLDPAGQPVEGAEVTFSISPPGLPTLTRRELTSAGVATWTGVRISREGAQRGEGLVTVMVVLPGGTTLQESVFFTID